MTDKITLELTIDELKLLDKYVEYGEETKELFDKLKQAYPQPRMEYQESGTIDKVEYNGHTYLRIVYDDSTSFGGVWWKQIERHKSPMNIVTDGETKNILEGLWFNQVKKGVIDEPEHYDEIEHDISENVENKTIRQVIDRWWMDTFTSKNMWSANECIDDLDDQIEFWILRNKKEVSVEEPTKPMDEVVERLVKKYQAQKLYNRLFEVGYDKEDCDMILSVVEDWLPEPQSAAGSQNLDVEFLVDGFNDAIRKMKEMLR